MRHKLGTGDQKRAAPAFRLRRPPGNDTHWNNTDHGCM